MERVRRRPMAGDGEGDRRSRERERERERGGDGEGDASNELARLELDDTSSAAPHMSSSVLARHMGWATCIVRVLARSGAPERLVVYEDGRRPNRWIKLLTVGYEVRLLLRSVRIG